MPAKLRQRWVLAQDSLWLVPGLFTLAAAALALILVQVDSRLIQGRLESYVPFVGGPEAARAVLETITGSTITVTGVVFSITMIALQLASSQYTPRVLRNFTSDRGNQVVLGGFIGTFTYTLLVLRTVDAAGQRPEDAAFVPALSVTVAIGFALATVGLLIFYIGHAAGAIQVTTIIDHAARDTMRTIERLFPQEFGQPAGRDAAAVLPTGPACLVTCEAPGYLQTVDQETLFGLAEHGSFVVRMELATGEYMLPGAVMASVWPAEQASDVVVTQVRKAFVTGGARTLQYDVEYGFRQIADIGVRALSPGVNDPTTAINCIDRLARLLVALGNRQAPEGVRADESGRVCFVVRQALFDEVVALSFDQIRHHAAGHPVVMRHLLRTLGQIAELVPAERRPPLARQAEAVTRAAEDIQEPWDRQRVEEAARTALQQTGGEGIC